jgi:hypothetical protein
MPCHMYLRSVQMTMLFVLPTLDVSADAISTHFYITRKLALRNFHKRWQECSHGRVLIICMAHTYFITDILYVLPHLLLQYPCIFTYAVSWHFRNCRSVNITLERRLCFCLILPYHLQAIFNHVTALTWTDKTLQACKRSFSIEPISLLT